MIRKHLRNSKATGRPMSSSVWSVPMSIPQRPRRVFNQLVRRQRQRQPQRYVALLLLQHTHIVDYITTG